MRNSIILPLLRQQAFRGPAPAYANGLGKAGSSRSASTLNEAVLPKGKQPYNPSAQAETQMRRFWKTVGIQPEPSTSSEPTSYTVTLDGRSLKTPSGKKLVIPANRATLAMLIANEWENQKKIMKVSGLPMTSLASRAIDGMDDVALREGIVDELMRYLDTDTTCFPSDGTSVIIRLQKENWEPLHKWYKQKYNIDIRTFPDLVLAAGDTFTQSSETRKVLKDIVMKYDGWQLAALERATYATKSFLIAFALVEGQIGADAAAKAANVEVQSQIELWGEVEDSHDVDHQDIRRQLGSVSCLLVQN